MIHVERLKRFCTERCLANLLVKATTRWIPGGNAQAARGQGLTAPIKRGFGKEDGAREE